MLGRITLIAIIALLGINVALVTLAQEESTEPATRPTLGDRLKRFRREIVGEETPPPRQETRGISPRNTRKMVAPAPPGTMPSPTTDGTQVESAPRAEHAPQSPIMMPPRMQVQGARPARGDSSRRAPPPDPATRSMREKMGPAYRPTDELHSKEARPEPMQPELAVEQETSARSAPAESRLPPPPEATEEMPDEAPHESLPHEAVPSEAMPLEDESSPGDKESPSEEIPESESELPGNSAGDESTAVSEGPSEPSEEIQGDQDALPHEARSIPADVPPEVPNEPAETVESAASPSPADSASNVLFTAQSPVLSVEASGPRKVMVGKEAVFLVKLRNAGAAANNVVVSVNVPNYAEVSSAEGSVGSARAATAGERHEALAWTIERLEANSEETLTLKLVPRKSSPLELAVNWTFAPETSQTMVEVQEPKLTMSLSGPTDVLFGQTKIYKLSLANPGNGDAENVAVGLAPIGRSGEATGTHRMGTLKAGESKTIDIELTARQAGAITIKAHAFADGGLRCEAAEQVLVRRASLQVEVEAPRVKYAGTPGTYRVKIENVGNAAADNARVSALLPPEAKFISASGGGRHEPREGRVEWLVGPLQPGGHRVFELEAELHAAGDNRLQFAAAADGDLSAAATSNTRVEAIADLKLEVRDPQGPIPVGEDAVYELRIHNRGTKAAEGVDLAAFFSEGLEPVTADGGQHEIGTGQVVFHPIAALAPDDTAVFHIRARAETAGNHVFRAEVTCQSLKTKLATEEATHFYGERRRTAVRDGQPHPAVPREEPQGPSEANAGEPTPAAQDEPTPAQGEPTPAEDSEPTPAAPEEAPPEDTSGE